MVPKKILEQAESLKRFLEDNRCSDVEILDVNPECSWADCFVIATVSSTGHRKGVVHVHLMSSELREFYSLEKLWAKKVEG